MFAIYTYNSQFAVDRIEEGAELYYQIVEDTDEAREEAKAHGKKFAHLFEEKTDEYNNVYYKYVTSIVMQ
ncbi:Uncharacterised protein [[Flavobacterium] thermophilum]|nr:Uncharacterised protein [[Flavobacterium] thermophilum]